MFIVAEIFPQHGGDLAVAEQMILQSKLAGADAVKLQLYPADMFSQDGLSRAYFELDFAGLRRLKEYGDRLNIDVFATAFTEDRLEWCLELDLKYLKVAARMHRESPDLVEKILAAGKKTFVSVPADLDVSGLNKADNATYLYCVAKYPTLLEEVSMPDFSTHPVFDGLSDHSIGIAAPLLASARGAKVLEKHFTLSPSWQKSTEKAHLGAMTWEDLLEIKRLTTDFELILGNGPGSQVKI